jgi:hypothetical protein
MYDCSVAVWTARRRRLREYVENGLPDGWQTGLWGGPAILFPPSGLLEPLVLEEGKGDHRHQHVSVEPGP